MSGWTTSGSTPGAVWRDLDPAPIHRATIQLEERAPRGGRTLRRHRPSAIGWTVVAHRSLQIASALHAVGVRHGDRVSVSVEAGPERAAVAYACWRLGAVVVVTSPELNVREERRAYAAARLQVVVADSRGLLLARGLRTPRLRIATERVPVLDELALGARYHLADLVTRRMLLALPAPPAPDDDAALVLARSGSESLGIRYAQSDLTRLREIATLGAPALTGCSGAGSWGAPPDAA